MISIMFKSTCSIPWVQDVMEATHERVWDPDIMQNCKGKVLRV